MLQSLRTRAQQRPSLIIGLLAASLALMMTGIRGAGTATIGIRGAGRAGCRLRGYEQNQP